MEMVAWGDPLGPEESEQLLDRITSEVTRRRLEVPAIMALEMHKPIFGYVTGMGIVFAPFLAPLLGPDSYRDLSRLFMNRENVEQLITRIEQAAQDRRRGGEVVA